ncbi:uncharacterized protein DS421_16g545210 [Arachis hypogaea]|nr:uncharacterized protein DS421_16g545210 [Arachis hypogaea]
MFTKARRSSSIRAMAWNASRASTTLPPPISPSPSPTTSLRSNPYASRWIDSGAPPPPNLNAISGKGLDCSEINEVSEIDEINCLLVESLMHFSSSSVSTLHNFDIDAAIESFKNALVLEPNDAGIKKELAAAKKKGC